MKLNAVDLDREQMRLTFESHIRYLMGQHDQFTSAA